MDARVVTHARFPAMDEEGWRTLVRRTLKGADLDSLATLTDDGIAYGPIALRRVDAKAAGRAEPDRPWSISQRVDDPDTKRAVAQARDDLAGGADGLTVAMAGAPGAFGFGLAAPAGPALSEILSAAEGRTVTIRLEGSALAARALADRLPAAPATRPAGRVHFGIDPVSAAASTGDGFAVDGRLLALAMPLLDATPQATVLRADGRVAHNAGATEAQELAVVMAALATYLRAGAQSGVAAATILAASELALSVDQNQFLAIAKVRAMRLLYRRLAELCGVAAAPPAQIHAETSFRMLATRDPETNIIRNTIAAFAAGVGGADSVAVLPHTLALGLPDAFARRIARNTQVLLIHESHLDQVADPAAGAGGIEDLTDALAEAAWREFQAIEAEGGIMESLRGGHFQGRVGAARTRRQEALAAGTLPIIGTTLYRLHDERPVSVLAPRALASMTARSGTDLRMVPHLLGAEAKDDAA